MLRIHLNLHNGWLSSWTGGFWTARKHVTWHNLITVINTLNSWLTSGKKTTSYACVNITCLIQYRCNDFTHGNKSRLLGAWILDNVQLERTQYSTWTQQYNKQCKQPSTLSLNNNDKPTLRSLHFTSESEFIGPKRYTYVHWTTGVQKVQKVVKLFNIKWNVNQRSHSYTTAPCIT